jgi:HAD superfamily hydrolase (TIGR01509 family)
MPNLTYEPAVLLDLDGTLVDSVYHHVLAWAEAFGAAGHQVALWKIHAAIGMGGQRLVPWLLGRHVDEADDLRDEHQRRFLERNDSLRAARGALELVDDLERRGVRFQIATSAEAEIGEALLDTLGRRDLPTADASDVGSPKPAPDLLLASCRELGAEPTQTTLVGDSPWDAEAAVKIGMRCVGVRTGGFSDERMVTGGAATVVDAPGDLVGRL